MSDQGYPGQGSEGSLQGAAGSPSPQPDLSKENAELKEENAKLREERRTERAKSLGTEHGLTPTEVSLLTRLNADEMETTAKALADERSAQTPPPAQGAPDPVPAPAPTPVPEGDAAALAAMASGGDATPPDGGGPPANSSDAMLREVDGAKSFEEVQEIQQKYKRLQVESQ